MHVWNHLKVITRSDINNDNHYHICIPADFVPGFFQEFKFFYFPILCKPPPKVAVCQTEMKNGMLAQVIDILHISSSVSAEIPGNKNGFIICRMCSSTYKRKNAISNTGANASKVGRVRVRTYCLNEMRKYSMDTATQGWMGEITYPRKTL